MIASPFGILFANEPSPGAVPLAAAVNQINMELSDRLAALQTGDYSAIETLEDLYHLFVRYAQVRQQAADHVQLVQQLRQGAVLVGIGMSTEI